MEPSIKAVSKRVTSFIKAKLHRTEHQQSISLYLFLNELNIFNVFKNEFTISNEF